MSENGFLDQHRSIVEEAGELTNANEGLQGHSFARPRLDAAAAMAHQSPTDRELLHRLPYVCSNGPDWPVAKQRRNGYTSVDLRTAWHATQNDDLESRLAVYETYVQAIANNGRPAHCVQVFDREYFRNQYGEKLDYEEPLSNATAVITWPVPLYWSVQRVILMLLHWDSMQCWWCGDEAGRMCDVEGYRDFVPVHCGGVTRVFPTCPACRQIFDTDLSGGLRLITVDDMIQLRNTGYPSDRRRYRVAQR